MKAFFCINSKWMIEFANLCSFSNRVPKIFLPSGEYFRNFLLQKDAVLSLSALVLLRRAGCILPYESEHSKVRKQRYQ